MKSAIRNPQAPIFLVGFMASGKSSVGEALAQKLSRPFIDLDKRIEAITERTIADLIENEGEERFRQIESEALRQSAQAAGAVIALGGGAMMRAENRELIAKIGITVWLDAPFELCWQRIQQDSAVRPLAPNREQARERYLKRQPFYQPSHLRIEISPAQSANDIANEIFRQLLTEADPEPQQSNGD
jgi:shikimate kinase